MFFASVKKYLALGLLLCVLPSLSNAACGCFPPIDTTHCMDTSDYTWHAVGSTWRNSECMVCSCGLFELECCDGYATPRQFPDDCVSVFDSKACQYIVHKKDDPTVECPIYAAVGKV
uniref:Beta-microseminoprotein n=1 Tax=Dicentrarchus labrax TaxID=13489 RepID=A0A8C4HUB5_DICLA